MELNPRSEPQTARAKMNGAGELMTIDPDEVLRRLAVEFDWTAEQDDLAADRAAGLVEVLIPADERTTEQAHDVAAVLGDLLAAGLLTLRATDGDDLDLGDPSRVGADLLRSAATRRAVAARQRLRRRR